MSAPISVCLITKRDPNLEPCLKSFASYVSEICIVINDADDRDSFAIARKYGAKVQLVTSCNDSEGRILDFSAARNRSLAMATQPWTMWCDSDDLIAGAEHLEGLIANAPDGVAFLLPYEYAYSDKGAVLCRHYRERLWRTGALQFTNPVHEVAVPQQPTTMVICDDVVFKHQRQYYPTRAVESGRNLRILKQHIANHPDDVRNLYYIGLEYANNNDIENAITHLTQYIDLSGWPDEIIMACLKLVEIYQNRADYKKGLQYAFKSLEVDDWFECYYAVCRMFYYQQNWKRCAHYGKLALSRPPTKTMLFVNETDRFTIHQYLNVALNHIGDVEGALASVNEGLKGLPDDSFLTTNRAIYERHLAAAKPTQPVQLERYDSTRLKIVFVTGPAYERWTPDSIKTSGIGGSETMLVNQSRSLAALGHDVVVYASPFQPGAVFDNVRYEDVSTFANLACDVLVVSRYAPFLSDTLNVQARLRLLWCHDVAAIAASPELLLRADRILALSEWHKSNLIKVHNVHPDHILVTRNGIDLDRFLSASLEPRNGFLVDPNHVERNPLRCVNSSSPDRSWPVLLNAWPEILKEEPKAELHLYYGFDNWKKSAANDPNQTALIARLEGLIATTPNVHYHGRVSEDELIREFRRSGVWLYSTWFDETSCISAMQAQAAGLHIVTSNRAALKETVLPTTQKNGYAVLLDGEWTSPEYKAQFVKHAVTALRRTERFTPYLRDVFDLDSLAADWQRMFRQLIEAKPTNPLVPYQPTRFYVRRDKTKRSTKVKLNIAAGPNVFPYDGWINLDKYDFRSYFDYISNDNVPLTGMPETQQKLATFLRDGGEFQFGRHDMIERLAFDDNSVDFVYVGQAIEHLNPIYQTPVFLKDCYRVLKPGGILRMTTPDLDKLIRAYNGYAVNNDTFAAFENDQPEWFKDADPSSKLAYLMFGACGPECTQEQYQGHFFCFTETSMTRFLTAAGFKDVSFTWPKCGKDKEIAMEIQDEGFSHSLIVECVK